MPAPMKFILVSTLLTIAGSIARGADVEISSLKELADYAQRSGNRVTMEPGVYWMDEFISLANVAERRKKADWQFLTFSGHNNVFNLTGVTVEFDTALRSALRPPIHTDEFVISGRGNTIRGLTITNTGDGVSLGGAVLGLIGEDNTLVDCTLHVRGSSPYGYGDLFGKGGYKHSGVHITGANWRLIRCKVFTKAFGHAFYIQENAADLLFENCHAEGVMRSTDEILRETSGLAFDRKFRTELKNRAGEAIVTPGYMKALSEDGFRTYGPQRNITFRNCTVCNMRGGFKLRQAVNARIERCTTSATERGYWIGSGGTIVGSRGDSQYGPLLFVEGDDATVDLTVAADESSMNVHTLATVFGAGHKITITAAAGPQRGRPVPILVGYGTPAAGDGAAPIPERPVRDVNLRNDTAMPVIVGSQARKCEIITRGPVQENAGQEITIQSLAKSK